MKILKEYQNREIIVMISCLLIYYVYMFGLCQKKMMNNHSKNHFKLIDERS